MADTEIEAWFQQQYETEVHVAYQRMGSKLRNTVRTKTGIVGTSTNFKKAGAVGEPGDKSRGGLVPVADGSMDNVNCPLTAKWLGDYVDNIDEIKHNADERAISANRIAYSHGRYTDKILFAALDATTNYVGDYTTGLSLNLLSQGIEDLKNADVPIMDGQLYGVLGVHQWEEFLRIPQVANSDWVGAEDLPWLSGNKAKRWRDILWMDHSGLPISGANATCFLYHKTAVGHAIGQDLTSKWSWENTRDAWFCNTSMYQGAVLIDAAGVVEIRCKNDTVLS